MCVREKRCATRGRVCTRGSAAPQPTAGDAAGARPDVRAEKVVGGLLCVRGVFGGRAISSKAGGRSSIYTDD